MRTPKILIGALFIALSIVSCNEDDKVTQDNDCDGDCTNVSLVDFNTMTAFFEANGVAEEVFVIQGEDGGEITGEKGTKVVFPSEAFVDQDNNAVIGSVDVKIKEIFSASDMVLSNRPTNALNNSGENTFLLSEGETEIVVVQNGEELSLAPGKALTISVPATGGQDSLMTAFAGTVNATDDIVWNQVRNTETWFQSAPETYFYNAFDTGWSNCDRFYSYPGDKTTNYVDLTSSPNMEQARVFIIFKENNLPAVVSFTQNYTDGLKSYDASLPLGLEVTYVAITINDNQQYLAIKDVVIAADENVELEFSAVSTDEITEALELLN